MICRRGEPRRYQIYLAALSKTRLADEGQLKEEKGGYTFFWKGKVADETRIHGVGFAIRNQLINYLHELPVGISERPMTIRLVLANNQMATVVSAYAPPLDSEEEVKETFYVCLDETLSRIPKDDKIILLGDFKRRVRELKNSWWTERALEIQRLADAGETRGFFSATKTIYGPRCHGLSPLRSKDGQVLLKDRESINARWKEHFQELLNRDISIEIDITKHIPQHPIREDMGEQPTITEVQDATRSPYWIPAEILKEEGPALLSHIHALLFRVWEKEELPSELRDVLIVSIFKKGDKADCGNYSGISLLSATGKVLARILANRLLPLSEELSESQCGFSPSRGTADMIFTARQIQEKCCEQRQPL